MAIIQIQVAYLMVMILEPLDRIIRQEAEKL